MTKLPSLTPIQIIRKLKKAGFVFDRQAKGSHEIWYNPKTKRRVVVPNHPGKDVAQRTLRSIVSQSGISPAAFNRL
jgi:predicted RNA binding protein YcfA (HicA-like mRNA interferase family)